MNNGCRSASPAHSVSNCSTTSGSSSRHGAASASGLSALGRAPEEEGTVSDAETLVMGGVMPSSTDLSVEDLTDNELQSQFEAAEDLADNELQSQFEAMIILEEQALRSGGFSIRIGFGKRRG